MMAPDPLRGKMGCARRTAPVDIGRVARKPSLLSSILGFRAAVPARLWRLVSSDFDLGSPDLGRFRQANRDTTPTREQSIQLLLDTYDDPAKREAARELCMPCIDAVLNAKE